MRRARIALGWGPLIPQSTIERVAAANDIVEVVTAVVPLKRVGARWMALCPFHREKSPSFNVDPARQSYKCFGCGVGGSVFGFVMAYENLDFPGAVRRLAERAGIVLQEDELRSGEADAAHSLRRRLIALHSEAADWFHRQLFKNPDAQVARDYLRRRGIDAQVARNWKLGYAPDEWSQLRDWARESGYSLEECLTAGLVVAREAEGGEGQARGRRSTYDRFRDRLMIPIHSDAGDVIAFSGRVLAADAKAAKYVNSPETPIFTKGAILFGLHKSRRAIIDAGKAIVCEGQLDLITAFEHGVHNVTAPQGTAFTPRQAALLKRCCDEVLLCFDADAAGQQAAERSFAALLEANMSVKVATMPPGEDPDSMIRQQGVEAFRGRLEAAQDFFDFQIERLSHLFDLEAPAGQAAFARRLAESVRLVSDNFLRDAVANKVASRLGVSAERFRELVARTPKRNFVQEDAAVQLAAKRAQQEPIETPVEAVRQLLALALDDAESRDWLRLRPDREAQLKSASGGRLLERILAGEFQPGQPASVNAFLAGFDPREAQYLSGLDPTPYRTRAAVIREDCWLDLEEERLLRRRDTLHQRMGAPGLEDHEVSTLHEEVIAMQARLREIGRIRSSRKSEF